MELRYEDPGIAPETRYIHDPLPVRRKPPESCLKAKSRRRYRSFLAGQIQGRKIPFKIVTNSKEKISAVRGNIFRVVSCGRFAPAVCEELLLSGAIRMFRINRRFAPQLFRIVVDCLPVL